jgi:hypothetical protein
MNELIGASGAQHVAAQDDQVRSHSDTDMVYMGAAFSSRRDRRSASASIRRPTTSSTGGSCSSIRGWSPMTTRSAT